MTSRALLYKFSYIAFVVLLYWIVSITSVFVNKALLSGEKLDVPYFVLWYQCFVSVLVCRVVALCADGPHFPRGSPFAKEAVLRVLPVSLLLTCMIVFNALCLKYGGVAFYYIGRSLTTVFNVLLSLAVLGEGVSGRTGLCCATIVAGFLLGLDQEAVLGTFSLGGTLAGVLASLSVALYSVYTKKVLPYLDNSIWALSYYNNLYSCVLLLPLLLYNEEIPKIVTRENIFDGYFWFLMTVGGLCGFSIGYVTSLQIKVTSPLTHNVSGTAKACVQTLLATAWYDERKNALWWISNYVILIGSFAYARVKQLEMIAKERIPGAVHRT